MKFLFQSPVILFVLCLFVVVNDVTGDNVGEAPIVDDKTNVIRSRYNLFHPAIDDAVNNTMTETLLEDSIPSMAPSNVVPSMAPSTSNSSKNDTTLSPAPTVTPAPSNNETGSPSPTTMIHPSPAPSASPTTPAPVTVAPTTSAPTTSAPTTSAPTTSAPTTSAPTTEAPSSAPNDDGHHHHGINIWQIVLKSIAWMVLAGLSVLGFAACMTHRYRIYYYLRGLWYSFLRLQCTHWILRKIRLDWYFYGSSTIGGGRGGGGSNYTSLNEIIFDGGNEGLLMRETLG